SHRVLPLLITNTYGYKEQKTDEKSSTREQVVRIQEEAELEEMSPDALRINA
ncbi:hypothetical protein KUCAC02_032568, partial [Chaenocephalus aceratus]